MSTRTTALAALTDQSLPVVGWRRGLLLVGEAFGFTCAGLYLMTFWGAQQGGVFSIFLSAAALTSRFKQLLDENRDSIWKKKKTPAKANLLTATSVLSMFAGMCLGFLSSVFYLGVAKAESNFAFALAAAQVGADSILTRSFSSFLPLWGHNVLVLVSIAVLSLIYRVYGALLGLAWNACVWVFALTFMVQRAVVSQSLGPGFVLAAIIAVLPHLILEAFSYVIASLGSVFFVTALTKYAPTDARFKAVAIACAKLYAFALCTLSVACLAEANLPRLILGRFVSS